MNPQHCDQLRASTAIAVLFFALTATGTARGASITNGGFESGLAGWTVADQLGSDGTFFVQSGTFSPVNSLPVPGPPEGVNAAMSDAQGPGSHVLYQDFVVPSFPAQVELSFALYVGNQAMDFFSPATLDFSTPELNQQFRVDMLLGGTDPFSLSPADVLLNVYNTNPGDLAVSGYRTISTDVSALLAAHAGETLRLRFAEVDNVFIFNVGVDNVQLQETSPIPEPSSLVVFGMSSLVGLIGFRLRRSGREKVRLAKRW